MTRDRAGSPGGSRTRRAGGRCTREAFLRPAPEARIGKATMRHVEASSLFGAAVLICLAAGAFTLCGCESNKRQMPTPQRESRPGEGQRLARAGEEALKKGNFEKAADLSSRAIAENPDIPGAWNNLGVALMEQQNYVDAAQALRRAAELSPTDPTPYENLGLLYYRAGYDQDALSAYTKALDRDPNWLPALRGAVACSQRLNIADEATQDRIRRGLMKEVDPAWREVFDRQRLRVDAELAERRKKASTP